MADINTLVDIVNKKGFKNISLKDIVPLNDIGSGSFGSVCTARDIQRQAVVAVKVLNIPEKIEKRRLHDLIREVEVMHGIRDEHILDIYGVCIDTEIPIYSIILPYMENGSIRGLLDDIEESKQELLLPWSLRTRMLHQVASGMTFLHGSKILHLDLKASNVLLNQDLHIKIADFGLSRWYTESSWSDYKLGGTLTHMPPEYLSDANRKPDEKFDSYSYGIFTWEVLTGAKPFENCINRSQLMMCILNGSRPDCDKLPEKVPCEHEFFVKNVAVPLMNQCWNSKPKIRKTMSEIKNILDPHGENVKMEAQREVPGFLANLRKAKSQENSDDKLPKNIQHMTMEEYVSEKNSNRLSDLKKLESLSEIEAMKPVAVEENPRTYADNPSVPVNPKHKAPSSSSTYVMTESSEGISRHIHAQPASAVPSIGSDLVSQKKENPKEEDSHSPFSQSDFESSKQSQNITNHTTYNISHTQNVHIGPSYVCQAPQVPTEKMINVIEDPHLGRNNIHIEDLKKEVSNDHLETISRQLGSKYWRLLGRKCLLLKDAELDYLYSDYHNVGEQEVVWQMLRKWKDTQGHKATREWIATGLVYINRKELLEILKT